MTYIKLFKTLQISIFKILLILMLICISNVAIASFERKTLEGFNWYTEKKEEFDKKHKLTNPKEKEQKLKEEIEEELPEYEKNIRSLQKRYKKAHRRALDNPTPQNLLSELRIEREMMNKSQLYGERKVVIAMLDSKMHDMREHSNVLHRKTQAALEEKEMEAKLLKLSNDWGLVLQVSEDCPHCHVFAPIVTDFANEFGFQLIAASKKGTDFKNIEGVRDMGKMLVFNPERVTPMLYLVKGDGKEVFPISRGVNNQAQIINNIKSIDKHLRRLF